MHRSVKVLGFLLAAVGSNHAYAGNHDPLAIIPLMGGAKLSLIDGIQLAEATYGPATSAKFEVDDAGKLVLSVYNIPEGLAVEPEVATLSEVVIDPSTNTPALAFEEFTDKEHIARAAAHMTLFRIAKLNLVDVLKIARRVGRATPIDVRNPTVVNNRPVAEVVLYDAKGRPLTVTVDLLTGRAKRS